MEMTSSILVHLAVVVMLWGDLCVSGRYHCYRRVKRGNRCSGYVRRVRYETAEACCAGRGQGFSEKKVRLSRWRFQCTPCLGNVGVVPTDDIWATGSGSPHRRHHHNQQKHGRVPFSRPTPSTTTTVATTTTTTTTKKTTSADSRSGEDADFYWPTPAGRDSYVGQPYPLPKDEDGNLIVWESWSPCSVSCGAGWRSRAKVCDNCDRNDYENVQSQPCMDNFYCPVDGNWGAWTPWDACSSSCGQGKRMRKRKCNYPPPAYGGATCDGDALAYKECQKEACPVDGAWGQWSEYSACSHTCGLQGVKTRARACDSPRPGPEGENCQGDRMETRTCQLEPCPVDGGWSMWSKWTPCSATCDRGVTERSRSCDNPSPQHDGKDCEGDTTQQQFCYTPKPCPVDGGWTEWVNYGYCRAPACGRGFQIKSRLCVNPRPSFGGQPCKGHQYKRIACINQRNCPRRNGSWCEWSDWNSCSASCKEDTPLQGRQRVCACPTPRHGGQTCQGEVFQVRECENVDYCLPLTDSDVPPAIEADIEEETGEGEDEEGTLDEITPTKGPNTTALQEPNSPEAQFHLNPTINDNSTNTSKVAGMPTTTTPENDSKDQLVTNLNSNKTTGQRDVDSDQPMLMLKSAHSHGHTDGGSLDEESDDELPDLQQARSKEVGDEREREHIENLQAPSSLVEAGSISDKRSTPKGKLDMDHLKAVRQSRRFGESSLKEEKQTIHKQNELTLEAAPQTVRIVLNAHGKSREHKEDGEGTP